MRRRGQPAKKDMRERECGVCAVQREKKKNPAFPPFSSMWVFLGFFPVRYVECVFFSHARGKKEFVRCACFAVQQAKDQNLGMETFCLMPCFLRAFLMVFLAFLRSFLSMREKSPRASNPG